MSDSFGRLELSSPFGDARHSLPMNDRSTLKAVFRVGRMFQDETCRVLIIQSRPRRPVFRRG